jgi:hypothetical protein
MAEVIVKLRDDVAQYITVRASQQNMEESEIVLDLIHSGYRQKLYDYYQAYQQGEISLSYFADELGITTWELYHLLEEMGWRTANV